MKLKIAVFFGGESVEHEVSIISGHQAMAALDKSKYDVIPVYISKDRKFYCSPLLEDMRARKFPLPRSLPPIYDGTAEILQSGVFRNG